MGEYDTTFGPTYNGPFQRLHREDLKEVLRVLNDERGFAKLSTPALERRLTISGDGSPVGPDDKPKPRRYTSN